MLGSGALNKKKMMIVQMTLKKAEVIITRNKAEATTTRIKVEVIMKWNKVEAEVIIMTQNRVEMRIITLLTLRKRNQVMTHQKKPLKSQKSMKITSTLMLIKTTTEEPALLTTEREDTTEFLQLVSIGPLQTVHSHGLHKWLKQE